jgi:hypothetical protein
MHADTIDKSQPLQSQMTPGMPTPSPVRIAFDKIRYAQANGDTGEDRYTNIPIPMEPIGFFGGDRFQVVEKIPVIEHGLDNRRNNGFGESGKAFLQRFDKRIDIGVYIKFGNRVFDRTCESAQFT